MTIDPDLDIDWEDEGRDDHESGDRASDEQDVG